MKSVTTITTLCTY